MSTINSPQLIWPLADLPPGRSAQAGGKGAALAALRQRGYPVPAGFVILPEAYRAGQLSSAAWQQIRQAAAGLPGSSVAVRSSARGEDGLTTSFAGGFDTILNVPLGTADDPSWAGLRTAVETVFAAGASERAAAYAAAQRVAAPAAMAVVVQVMVPADMAGVLFTVDPVHGNHNVMTGNFVHGLGEAVVSGAANAAVFTLNRPAGVYDGPAELRPFARQLFRLGQKLAAELGGPQDIEWAIAGGQIALLQARPITTLQAYQPATGEWNDSRRGHYLWSNANFGEAIPGVMTPLTWSLIRIYGQETLGNPFPGDHPFMGNIGGRFYVNLSLFASLFQTLGMSRERMKSESELFFGNVPDDLPIPTIPFSRWQLLRRFVPYALRTMRRRRRNLRELAAFTAAVPARYTTLKQAIDDTANAPALAHLWQRELEPLLRRAYQMLQAGTSDYENRYRPLQKELAAAVGGASANLLLSGVSGDGDTLASLNPLLGLWRVQQGELSRETYRLRYGHRGEHEMELNWVRPAEDPSWLDQQLASLADQDVPALLARRAAEKAAAWQAYQADHGAAAAKMQSKLETAAAAARAREAIRSETTRLIFLMRHFALRAGALTGLGEDVFFLWLEELLPHLSGAPVDTTAIATRRQAHEKLAALPPYPGLINGRFDPERWASDPNRRGDIFDAVNPSAAKTAPAAANGHVLHGTPGSTGRAVGRVRRLENVGDGHLLQPGEILVAATTNVGWTPLFPRAAAIVTDVGAPLSHAAIVARELGLPAVVGTGRATMFLQTGDLVRVDGGQGTVERLPAGAAA